ncbi:MAG: DUF3054 domain-containing protein [Ilumatobacteraceae bacterium]
MSRSDRVPVAVGLDVFVVIVFVAIGRRNHDESSAFVDVVRTGAPFLLGLAAGWAAAKVWEHPVDVKTGLVVWPVTVIVGMLLRRFAFDRGTAPAFVVVAVLFLGAGLVGWRLVGRVLRVRRLTRI